MRLAWWKIVCILMLLLVSVAGFVGVVPAKPILNETIRNYYFHIPMWFGMMIFFTVSVVYSVKYLRNGNLNHDIKAIEFANVGLLYCLLGLITGMIWANYTWGKPWSNDPKQIGAAIAFLIYFAYLVLRSSLIDPDKRAKIGAVYNIFAFAMLFPTIWIIPRLLESLHPGGMGNPALNPKDVDSSMRLWFYLAAFPGWTLLGIWMASLCIRLKKLEEKKLEHA